MQIVAHQSTPKRSLCPPQSTGSAGLEQPVRALGSILGFCEEWELGESGAKHLLQLYATGSDEALHLTPPKHDALLTVEDRLAELVAYQDAASTLATASPARRDQGQLFMGQQSQAAHTEMVATLARYHEDLMTDIIAGRGPGRAGAALDMFTASPAVENWIRVDWERLKDLPVEAPLAEVIVQAIEDSNTRRRSRHKRTNEEAFNEVLDWVREWRNHHPNTPLRDLGRPDLHQFSGMTPASTNQFLWKYGCIKLPRIRRAFGLTDDIE